jgi:hypothetical protein
MGAESDANLRTISIEDEGAIAYGTTRTEYKLWIDYVFDLFGATLERRFRRYLVALIFATIIWLCGLAILAPFGLAITYLTTPGIYLFWIGITWCSNALRWLSQVYHVRTNAVRPCFPIADGEYKAFVSPFARRATDNAHIFAWSAVILFIIAAYTWAIFFSTGQPGEILALSFPRSFPSVWLSLDNVMPKMVVLDLLYGVTIIHVYTGAHLTRSTAPLYAKLSTLPVVPVPNLVTELFRGILGLYQSGALMWSFGIILAELLYEAQLEPISIGFIATVIIFGMVAFLLPQRAVHKIWRKAHDEAVGIAIREYYAYSGAQVPIDELSKLNAILSPTHTSVDFVQIANLILGQLLPLLPLLIPLVSRYALL